MEVKGEVCQTQGEKGHERQGQGGGHAKEGRQTGKSPLQWRLWGHC